MIVSPQPGARTPRPAGNLAMDPVYSPNYILSGRGRQYEWQGLGSLSIKTFRGGRAFYDVGDGHFAVDETSYLLLNHAQRYTITIDSDVTVESFCLFLGAEFVKDVFHAMRHPTEELLDKPLAPPDAPV